MAVGMDRNSGGVGGQREALAAALAGAPFAWPTASEELQALLGCAWSEGVVGLLSARLDGEPDVPDPVRAACSEWVRGQVAATMVRQARLRRVLDALDEAGISTLVVKGVALAQWLYPASYLRESSDVDLLFASRAEAERAAAALVPLGFASPYRPERFRHELLCRSGDGKLDLDLHWALSDWPALSRLPDFAALHAARIALPGLGDAAFGLDAPHALLHACVHRASNLSAGLGDRLKWLYDLHLLAGALDAGDGWGRFVEVAKQAQGCGMCAEGLAASTELFGTKVPGEVTQALDAGRAAEPLDARRLAGWGYVQRVNFRALGGWGERAAWLWSRLLPPAGHMRELYGEEHGRAGLLWQRLRRAFARVR